MAAPSTDPYINPAAAAPAAKPNHPRLWPAIGLVAAYWLGWLIVTVFYPATFTQFLVLFWSPMVVAAGMLIWWLGFSRLPVAYRFFGVGCVVLGGLATTQLIDKSMGMGLLMYALPVVLTTAVAWLVITRGAKSSGALAGLVTVTLLAWGYYTLIRVDGINGALAAERSWRWTPTAEDKYLAGQRKLAAEKKGEAADQLSLASVKPLIATPSDWPEFRGVARDGHVRGIEITTDWSVQPPREVWRRRVGPGWSSFAVIGDRVFTQEQRGEAEAVLCFDLSTGNEIWSHEDRTRFWEVVAGAGPRGTPTFHEGKIYTLGGGGKLNCLDAPTGKAIWTCDIATDADTKPPQWGFSSSPLVVQGMVFVFAGSMPDPAKKDEKAPHVRNTNKKSGVLAYDAGTGEPKWAASNGTHSYSSPQALKVSGIEQIVMVTDHGLEAFEPATGKLLWDHAWYLEGMFRVCQPHIISASQLETSQILLGTGMGSGTRLLEIAKNDETWKVTEKWTSKDLKPYFNDFVSRDGHLYGFDGDIFVCIDLATGKKKWKKGRYGHGQCLLVGDGGHLIIVSETGEAVLAEATPQGLTERGKFQALTGKTWNHPVIAAGKLLFRNSEDMACYELTASPPAEKVAAFIR